MDCRPFGTRNYCQPVLSDGLRAVVFGRYHAFGSFFISLGEFRSNVDRLPLPLAPRWLRWVGVVGVASIIVYFSLVTTVPGPPDPGPIWDKKLHFAAYAGFAVALAYATVEWQSRRVVRGGSVLGVALVFGLTIEVAQGHLPMRYYSHVDLLANLIGASLVVPWLAFERRVRYFHLGE